MSQPVPGNPGMATDEAPRCRRMLAKLVTRPWFIVCQRCKAENHSG